MQAVVWCRVNDGDEVALGHGDIIGRMGSASLVIDDARVSEAHAIVSLRRGALHLLALRGRFAVGGRVLAEMELAPGLALDLAEGLTLHITDLVLPEWLLGIAGPGLPAQVLSGTTSLDLAPGPQLRPGWRPDARAWLWNVDQHWKIQVAGEPPRPFSLRDKVVIDGFELKAVAVPLTAAGVPRTQHEHVAPIRLSACVNTVQVQVGAHAPVVIGGLPGRLLAELAAIDGPVGWEVVARELWVDDEPVALRRRWDVSLSRLRGKLRAIGVRDDLIASDGSGQVELVLRDGDALTLRDA